MLMDIWHKKVVDFNNKYIDYVCFDYIHVNRNFDLILIHLKSISLMYTFDLAIRSYRVFFISCTYMSNTKPII